MSDLFYKNYIFYIFVFGLAIDRIFKYLALEGNYFLEGGFLLGNHFGLTFFLNKEFAWGAPISNLFTVFLMIASLIFLFHYYQKNKNIYLILIILGACSNLFDRIFYGGVIDYLLVPWGGIINLADLMISVGVAAFIIYVNKNKFLRGYRS